MHIHSFNSEPEKRYESQISFKKRKYDQYEPIQEEKIWYNIIGQRIRRSQSGATVRELQSFANARTYNSRFWKRTSSKNFFFLFTSDFVSLEIHIWKRIRWIAPHLSVLLDMHIFDFTNAAVSHCISNFQVFSIAWIFEEHLQGF